MTVSTAPSPQKTSVVEDFIDIFYAPATVYERRRDSSAWLPLIVVSVLTGLLWLASTDAMQPLMEAEYQRGMQAALEANPGMTAEQLAQGRALAEGFGKFAFVAGTPIAIFFTGLALMMTSKLVEANVKLGAGVLIAAWAFVPRIVGAILNAAQVYLVKPESLDGMYRLTFSPARFLDPDSASALLLAVAGRFDVFILWSTFLLGVGLAVVARIPRSQAMVAAVAVWVLAALPTVYSAIGQ